jgi:hypothetical protein
MKVVVYHRTFCDTGCCGHAVGIYPDDHDFSDWDKWDHPGTEKGFSFSHPYGSGSYYSCGAELSDYDKEFIRNAVTEEFGEDHVKDIDWEHCVVCDD